MPPISWKGNENSLRIKAHSLLNYFQIMKSLNSKAVLKYPHKKKKKLIYIAAKQFQHECGDAAVDSDQNVHAG